MVFQLLEDLTEMSTIKDCKDIFGYIESKQDVLGKVIVICISFCLVSSGEVQKMHIHNFADGLSCWVVSSKSFLGVENWLC